MDRSIELAVNKTVNRMKTVLRPNVKAANIFCTCSLRDRI